LVKGVRRLDNDVYGTIIKIIDNELSKFGNLFEFESLGDSEQPPNTYIYLNVQII